MARKVERTVLTKAQKRLMLTVTLYVATKGLTIINTTRVMIVIASKVAKRGRMKAEMKLTSRV